VCCPPMFGCCSGSAKSSPKLPTRIVRDATKRKLEANGSGTKKPRFEPSPRSRVSLPTQVCCPNAWPAPNCGGVLTALDPCPRGAQHTLPSSLQRKLEGWLKEALHILNLAQCGSTEAEVKVGLFSYASELLQAAIKLDASRGSEVARVLVEMCTKAESSRVCNHADGILELSMDPLLMTETRAAMEKCARELFSTTVQMEPMHIRAKHGLVTAENALRKTRTLTAVLGRGLVDSIP
jgi:hypothetical protein